MMLHWIKSKRKFASFVVRFWLFTLFFGLFQLLFPHIVSSVFVYVGKYEVEHVRIPACSMAFDAVLDVLGDFSAFDSNIRSSMNAYLRQFQPVGHIVSGKDDRLRTSTPSSHCFLSQPSNT